MPYRRAESVHWWISYTGPDGRQIRRSSETAIYEDAKAIEQKLRAESHEQRKRAGPRARAGNFDTVLAEYLTPRITRRTRTTARHLAATFSGQHIGQITAHSVRIYITNRKAAGAAPATVNKELAMLSAAINSYNYHHSTSLINPVRGLKQREPEGKLRWLTRDEYECLVAASSDHIRDFVRLACNTGMRRGEALGLTWDRVDFGRRLVTLEAEHTKSRKRRSVPLNTEALAALSSRAIAGTGSEYVFCGRSGPIGDIKKGFAAACRRAGLRDVSPHTCRHTFASWLVTAGVSLYEVRDLLGHSTIKLTERYAHLAPENLRTAVDKIAAA